MSLSQAPERPARPASVPPPADALAPPVSPLALVVAVLLLVLLVWSLAWVS